ncbi:MAG: hypothetical protein SAK29_12400 [Scytonema sp. PMC 1069.18]|nr:hypothetical protein [Scytonema sp. PMC 1069.18]MEC4885910.1 hypothetical protein [Scytonema sp. PMC 1070.18]
MKIYVQSRGLSQDYDYCWLPEVPPILKKYRINDLIQSESPSLVLGRYENQLILLITGLEASERADVQRRKIRNSVAWVGEDNQENEEKLRAIAACALQDKLKETLQDEIDQAVTFGGEFGFQVAFEDISQLSVAETITTRSFPAKVDKKIGKNSKNLRDNLAYDLEESCLPKGNDFNNTPLVIVTGIKSENALKQAGVWRGLSNLVQGEGWKDPYKKSLTPEPEYALSNQTHKQNNALVYLLVSSILIPIAIALLLFLPK